MSIREIVLSSADAALLSGLVRRLTSRNALDDTLDELADALDNARVVSPERLPSSVVALGSAVKYTELPEGPTRTVVLVHPTNADAVRGRISVLSPVGRALLGRRVGNVLALDLPTGERRRIEVIHVSSGGSHD